MNFFKRKQETYKLKCGEEFLVNPDYLSVAEAAFHVVGEHDKTIIIEGINRKKRVVCIPTGKWWYEEMPPLEEIKN